MDYLRLLKGMAPRRLHPLCYVAMHVLLVVAFASGTWDALRLVEASFLAGGVLFLPWIFRRHYWFACRDPLWLAGIVAVCAALGLPGVWGLFPSPVKLVCTLLFIIYGLPLLRSQRGVGIVAWLLLGVGALIYMIPFAFFLIERCRPTSDLWLALLQTNPGEALEYLASHRWWPALIPPIGLMLCFFHCGRRIRPGRPRWRTAVLFIGLFITQVTSGATEELSLVWGRYQEEKATWKSMLEEREHGLINIAFTAIPSPVPRKIMIVLGESTTRRHMGLYGYEAPTTPALEEVQRQGGLFLFDDVISPHTLTMQSLEKVLTNSNNEFPTPFAKSLSVIDIFHRAGFHTKWISNQNRAGIFDNQVSVIANSADCIRFSSTRVGTDYEAEPDEVLLPMVDRALPESQRNTLVFVHLMGAHWEYPRRVPIGYGTQESKQKAGLGGYDLAIRYGDSVLTKLIRKAQDAGFDTVVFLSDHGESPHDGRRHNPGEYVPEMVEIPFLIWLSPAFREAHPECALRIGRACHRPYMTDDFFHTLIDLAGIQSSAFDPTRSVVNDAFKVRPRRVIHGQIAYEPARDPHLSEGQ